MMMDLKSNLSSIYVSLEIRAQLKANSQKLKAFFAEVVKLANTLRSGRSGRKSLRVQLPPSAILENQRTKRIIGYKNKKEDML